MCVKGTSLLREGWPGPPVPPNASGRSIESMSKLSLSANEQSVEDARLAAAFREVFSLIHHDHHDHHLESDKDDELLEFPEDGFRVVVCHANLIRYFICRALGVSAVNVWGQFEINHAGLTRIDIGANGQFKVLAVNECGHLPPSLHTSSEDHM